MVLALGLAYASERFDAGRTIDGVLTENRATVYGTLASLLGSLLGFVITALSILLGFSDSPRLEFLRGSKHYETLWRVFIKTIEALALATAVSLAGLFFDRESQPRSVIAYAVAWLLILTVFRVGRCVWILKRVVQILSQPSKTRPGGH